MYPLLETAEEKFLSTPSARRATEVFVLGEVTVSISIHALREEGDPATLNALVHELKFLSTPSARRATDSSFSSIAGITIFLSTPSARRATGREHPCPQGSWYFYPRPPRGGRQLQYQTQGHHSKISIHALREEGDDGRTLERHSGIYFYPRPPRGGRHLHSGL